MKHPLSFLVSVLLVLTNGGFFVASLSQTPTDNRRTTNIFNAENRESNT